MIDWIEELLARFRDGEREEDGSLLLDLGIKLFVPGLLPEQGAGVEAEKDGQAGPESGAELRSAETDAWNAPDGTMGLSRTEDGLIRQKKPEFDGENGYSGTLNGGIWLNGATERQAADGMPGSGRQTDGETGPGAVLDGLAQALSRMGQRDGTERHGAVWPDEMAVIPADWAAAELKGTRAFADLDKTARIEAGSGVEWLYRQTAGAERPAAPGPTVQTVGQAETEIGPAALTLEELDRAVRRDSRRYDGEMCIY